MRLATRPIMSLSRCLCKGHDDRALRRVHGQPERFSRSIPRADFSGNRPGASIASSPERPRAPSFAGRITMTRFGVRTLGFPEIRREDRLCQLTLRKGLALLVYLAEAKGSVGRDVVATMLWPESSEEVVRARLRRLLHRLQLTLGDDVLTTDRSTVRWSSAIDLQVDSQQFEQACDRGEFEPACRRYLGDFLAGFSPGECPQFDELVFFRREALPCR